MSETYTAQYVYSDFGGESVTERVREVVYDPTVAECAVFEYFAPCSPSIFESTAYLRLREAAPPELGSKLDALKAIAGEEHKRIVMRITGELAERFECELPKRFDANLKARIEMVTDKHREIARVRPVTLKRFRSAIVMSVWVVVFAAGCITPLCLFGDRIDPVIITVVLFVFLLIICVSFSYVFGGIPLDGKHGRRRSNAEKSVSAFREYGDFVRLQKIYREIGAGYMSAQKMLYEMFPELKR